MTVHRAQLKMTNIYCFFSHFFLINVGVNGISFGFGLQKTLWSSYVHFLSDIL